MSNLETVAQVGENEALARKRCAAARHEVIGEAWHGLQQVDLCGPFALYRGRDCIATFRIFDGGFEQRGERQAAQPFVQRRPAGELEGWKPVARNRVFSSG